MSSEDIKTSYKKNYTERFAEVCGTNQAAEVARTLEISYQAAKNYLNGRLPDSSVLMSIAERTPYSLHWLLTGKGEKFVSETDSPLNTLIPADQIRILIREEMSSILNDRLRDQTTKSDAAAGTSKETNESKNVVLTAALIKHEKPAEQSNILSEKQINGKTD